FHKNGEHAVFVPRWITGVRVIGALVPGTSTMPWRRFLLFNCLRAVTWVTAISLLAYFFAVNVPLLLIVVSRSGWALLGLIAGIALIFYLKRRLSVDQEPAARH